MILKNWHAQVKNKSDNETKPKHQLSSHAEDTLGYNKWLIWKADNNFSTEWVIVSNWKLKFFR